MRVCVVIPAYNEARNLPVLLPRVFAQAEFLPGWELSVLVVDDDSTDGTRAVLAELQTRYSALYVLHGPKRGLGVAYERGFAYAVERLGAERLVEMDGDQQHDPAALPYLIHACVDGVAAVVGSRFAPGGETPTFSARRRLTSVVGNWLIYRVTGLPHLHDYTSGFRCLDARLAAEALRRCHQDHLATRGYAFQSSLIAEILLTGAPVRELPIIFGEREFGQSKLSRRDYWEFLANLRGLRTRRRNQLRAQ